MNWFDLCQTLRKSVLKSILQTNIGSTLKIKFSKNIMVIREKCILNGFVQTILKNKKSINTVWFKVVGKKL